MKERTCNNCGWVHFAVTRQHAEEEVKRFNEFFDTLTEEKQQQFYGGKHSTIAQYEHCFLCGNTYKDFRDAKEEDCPIGVTLGPIIGEE